MNQLALRKSVLMKKIYNINSFPIPLWQIEQAIIDQGFDVIISKSLKKPCVVKRTVYIPFTTDFNNRFFLSHELGHILCHNCNIHQLNPIIKNKYEAQANAFASYFLMPPGMFERDLKQLNEWDLAEKYGVPVESVIKRAALITEPSNKEMRLY